MLVDDTVGMAISIESSTYDFLLSLSRNLREGEALADALSHAHKGAEASPTAEQTQRLREHLERLRAVNQQALTRYHQDDGV